MVVAEALLPPHVAVGATGIVLPVISFAVYGKAEPAGSKRAFVNPQSGRAIVTDANKNTKHWQRAISEKAYEIMDGNDILEGPLQLSVTFVVPRPKGHRTSVGNVSAAGRRQPHPTVRPDLLKLTRAVEDALSGIVYRDDAQIVKESLQKVYGEPEHCRIIVMPMPVEAS